MSYRATGTIEIKNVDLLKEVCTELGLEISVSEAAAYFRRMGNLEIKIEGFPLSFFLNSETGVFTYDTDMFSNTMFCFKEGLAERKVNYNKILNLYVLRTLERESGRTFNAFWNEDGTLTISSEYGDNRTVAINASKDGLQVEAHGFDGQGCKQSVLELTQLLGTVEQEIVKDEYYRDDPQGGMLDAFATY